MNKAQYGHFDEMVLAMLRNQDLTAGQIRQSLGMTCAVWTVVRQRMSGKRLIASRRETRSQATVWTVHKPPALKDPSPFPRPWWRTPKVGWFG